MAHAFAEFIRQQMDERGMRQRDVATASGLSRQLVSKYATDDRDTLSRLPSKDTIDAFARAFNVSPEFLLGKAIEALGLGYTSGDFINSVDTATDRELLDQIQKRLAATGSEGRDRGKLQRAATGVVGIRKVSEPARTTDDLPAVAHEQGDIQREQEESQESP